MTKLHLPPTARFGLILALAAVLGFCAVVIPGLLLAPSISQAPLFPQVRSGVMHMPSYSYFLLFLVGALLGTIEPRYPRSIGVSSVIILPLVTVGEKAMDITSHPGMAWEITYYFALSVATCFGAYLGKELRS